jgi:hypothetical protein
VAEELDVANRLAAAEAAPEDVAEWVAEMVEGYVGERPVTLPAGLDSVGELLRLGLWLHAEAVWQREDALDHAGRMSNARRDADAVSDRLRAFANRLLRLDDPTDADGVEDRRTITLNEIIRSARLALEHTDGYVTEVESSRQAWAEEAMRLDTALDVIAEHCEELSAKADTKIGEVAGADLAWAAWGRAAQWMRHARNQRPCTLPDCAVHPVSSSVIPDGEAQ